MEFGKKTTIKGAPAIVGSYSGGNIIQQTMVANDVTGLEPGHVVVIESGVIKTRWDGTKATIPKWALAIVTTKQFEGDNSVSTLRFGTYIRDRVLLEDDIALDASSEFYMSLHYLYAEGSWL
ncbi:conserved hypothetical protein [Vibrio aestuarianus]|nr:conserved hypothetical protein [Vibrio aestuarianus]